MPAKFFNETVGRWMISHKHKCVFVEVPKTGSTSVRAILGKAWKPHLNLWQIKKLMETSWTHYGGRKLRTLGAVFDAAGRAPEKTGSKQFETYFKFGFVRNPWDRVVSLYERTEALQLRNEMSFEQFVDWIQYSSATCVHSSPHRYQLELVCRPTSGWPISSENLSDSMKIRAFVARKLGLEEKFSPHRRANPRERHYTEYDTPRTRDIIAAKFKVDIERFDYEFAG